MADTKAAEPTLEELQSQLAEVTEKRQAYQAALQQAIRRKSQDEEKEIRAALPSIMAEEKTLSSRVRVEEAKRFIESEPDREKEYKREAAKVEAETAEAYKKRAAIEQKWMAAALKHQKKWQKTEQGLKELIEQLLEIEDEYWEGRQSMENEYNAVPHLQPTTFPLDHNVWLYHGHQLLLENRTDPAFRESPGAREREALMREIRFLWDSLHGGLAVR